MIFFAFVGGCCFDLFSHAINFRYSAVCWANWKIPNVLFLLLLLLFLLLLLYLATIRRFNFIFTTIVWNENESFCNNKQTNNWHTALIKCWSMSLIDWLHLFLWVRLLHYILVLDVVWYLERCGEIINLYFAPKSF